MGGGRWDSDAYTRSTDNRRSTGTKDFAYDDDVKTGKASGIHPDLDPRKVAGPTSPLAGQPVRESRDSDEHPETVPVAVLFDVTGSMLKIPQMLQTKLATLMDVILAKAAVAHPNLLVGAIGDSHSDKYPLQVGQFESDNRFDEQLRNIILEGNGGGQGKESYGLAWKFAADHTATDAYEKRGKRGYLFTMGDESLWPTITATEVEQIFEVAAKADESVESLLERAREKWDVYHLGCLDGSYRGDTEIQNRWAELLGERYVKLDNSELVCEVIAGIILMMEASYDADKAVGAMGLKGTASASVKNALVPLTRSVPAHVAKGAMPGGARTKTSTTTAV